MTMRELIDMVDDRHEKKSKLQELINVIDFEKAEPNTVRDLVRSVFAPGPTARSDAEMAAQYGDAYADEMDQLEAEKLAAQVGKLEADAQAVIYRAGIKRIS